MIKLKSTNTVKTEVFEADCGNGIKFFEQRTNDKVTKQWFKSKIHNYLRDSYREFQYFPNLAAFIGTKELYHISGEDYEFILETPIIEDISKFDDWENVWLYNISNDGFLYHIWKKEPVSSLIRGHYIGGFTNKDYDLKSCAEHLSKNENIFDINIDEIPYYNSDFTGHKGLSYYVWPDEAQIDQLFYKYKDKEQYWSCVVRDSFTCHYRGDDILGLQKFKLKVPLQSDDRDND